MIFNPNTDTLWHGKEVEGRLAGLSTLFVGGKASPDSIRAEFGKWQQVYFNRPHTKRHGWAVVLDALAFRPAFVVTVAMPVDELAALPIEVAQQAHVMAVVQANGVQWLKATDTVRLDLGPAHSASVTVGQLVVADPEAYDADEPLTDMADGRDAADKAAACLA